MLVVLVVIIIIIILLHSDVRQDRKGSSEQSFLGFIFSRWLFMPLTSTIIIFSFLFFSCPCKDNPGSRVTVASQNELGNAPLFSILWKGLCKMGIT